MIRITGDIVLISLPTRGVGWSGLGHALASSEGSDGVAVGLRSLRHLDGTELLLVAHDVLLQGSEKTFCVLGSQDDARSHVGLWHTREETGEVEDKVTVGVADQSEI